MRKVKIETFTGCEQLPSRGAYGWVYVGLTKVPHYIYHTCETDWEKATAVGSKGKYGRWFSSTFVVDEEILIYTDGAERREGKPDDRGQGWFIADPDAPKVVITTPGHDERHLIVVGRLRPTTIGELSERDMLVVPRGHLHVEEVKSNEN